MRRIALTTVTTMTALGLVATPALSGGTAGRAPAAAKLRVIISEKGRFPVPGGGTFVLSGPAGSDSGRTAVTPGPGPDRIRDGQSFHVVKGTDHLYGKRGELMIRFTGVSIDIADEADVEYGTWSIYTAFSTGAYEGWRGGGRWASSSKGGLYVVRWEGLITP